MQIVFLELVPEICNSQLLAAKPTAGYTKEVLSMDTKEVLYQLRIKNDLSQDALAEKVFVTRQAVSA